MGKINEFYSKFKVLCSEFKDFAILGGKTLIPPVNMPAPETGKVKENGNENVTRAFRKKLSIFRAFKQPQPQEKKNVPKVDVH